ncbi:hypothetical protein GCM10028803_55230 [Larkinella knui]|uniref:Helix-turn-helix domain-containing protein n=1 Tax=Larkinella knui TaxID=2025310 RepID=A0A3P1CG21_9BACT|nr:helix-turn-helix domain-containing protein [Larkinella knui]RRB12282.1 helix-turn-helix domain-containing protein [Larkinella knui]
MKSGADTQPITQVHDMPSVVTPGLTPVARSYFEDWNIRVIDRVESGCDNYMSPNRRDFYKIMFMTSGTALKSLGTSNYQIEAPTILFLHPNEIVCWRNLSGKPAGIYCMFKKRYLDQHPTLKALVERYKFFTEKRIIRLSDSSFQAIQPLFQQLLNLTETGGELAEESMQAYLQLVLIESLKGAQYPTAHEVTDDYRHVHDFFQLLEKVTATINLYTPVKMRTAGEFAEQLGLHPNYLNRLLKKHTGQNISTHIKDRLLEESKALLLQTDWTLQEIGQCIGFADQPNFSQFFKKYMGITPNDFRRTPLSPVY